MAQMLPLASRAGINDSYQSAFNFGRGMAANLRGLGAGATLVLVNGHRQAMSGVDGDFVDLSSIPWSAVERIDVLPDGASALYGSDAIAGVVNVITRTDAKGNETIGRLGNTPDGAAEKLASQISAWDWPSGHVLLTYQFAQRGALAAEERAYSASSDKRALGGGDFRSSRASPGNILDPRTLVPAYAIQPSGAGSVSDLIPNFTNLQDRNKALELLPFRRDHGAFISARETIGGTELFLEGRANARRIHQAAYPQEQTLLVPASNPYAINPFPGLPLLVAYSFADSLGPITIEARSFGTDVTSGFRKKIGDWHLEFSATRGDEDLHFTLPNQPDQARLQMALADPSPSSAFNAFGSNNPETLDFIQSGREWSSRSTLSDASLVADRKVWTSNSVEGMLGMGVSWRREHLQRTIPTDASFSRSVNSAFAEIRVPIAPVVSSSSSYPRLELSAAGRVESYSDFGSSTNPRVAVKWAPTSELRVRSSWGTAFRAPKLVDIYDVNSSAIIFAVIPDPRSATGVSPVLIRQGANRELHEETAHTWTVGLDFAPERLPVRASVTYFDIVYRGRIVRPGPLVAGDILREESLWPDIINRQPTRTEIEALCDDRFFRGDREQCRSTPIVAVLDQRQRNTATTIARGLDFSADAETQTTYGLFTATFRMAYTLKFTQRASGASPSADLLDTVGNPLALKSRAGAEWRQRRSSGWFGSIGLEYDGAYRDTSRGSSVNSFKSIDISLGRNTGPALGMFSDTSVDLSIANVLNAAPPFVNTEAGYDVANAVPFGRVTTLSFEKRW
jgi:iron complex outermembrane receptor protein